MSDPKALFYLKDFYLIIITIQSKTSILSHFFNLKIYNKLQNTIKAMLGQKKFGEEGILSLLVSSLLSLSFVNLYTVHFPQIKVHKSKQTNTWQLINKFKNNFVK